MSENTAKKRWKVVDDLRRIVEFWPLIVATGAVIVFLWGPIKSAANIASKDVVDNIETRLKSVESSSLSANQELKLLSIAIGEINGKLTEQEAKYFSDQVIRGKLNDTALQMKLYGVTGIVP